MPLPFILGGIAVAAGAAGVKKVVDGGVKMKEANDTMNEAKSIHEKAIERFNRANDATTTLMDELGKQELEILSTFDDFSDIIEKIQNRPEFEEYKKDGIDLPKYEAEELKKVSAGATALLGGIGGAAAGTAGGFAAAGATTSAVIAFGAASTGTAISSLSGIAATNAVLAALGGGSLAAGGGGVALGTAILGGATLGVGLLVGGLIFNVVGSKLSDKADEAYQQAKRTEREINRIVQYLDELRTYANKFKRSLTRVEKSYRKYLNYLDYIVNFQNKREWEEFTPKEKMATENEVLLVGLLYTMCKVELVLKQDKKEINKVNKSEINSAVKKANTVMDDIGDAA